MLSTERFCAPHDGGYPIEMNFTMSDHSHKYKPLLMALTFSCIATTANPVNAMPFPNAQVQEAKISAKKGIEKKEDTAVPIEPQSTVLPDGLNTIIDTLENPQDVKHYSFTAVRGQKVMVYEVRQSPEKSPWKIEYKIDQIWNAIPHKPPYVTPTLTPQQQVHIKVSRDLTKALQSGEHYEIEFGSAPRPMNHKVSGNADRYSIRFGVHKFADGKPMPASRAIAFMMNERSAGHTLRPALRLYCRSNWPTLLCTPLPAR
jgi:hypothetical protein